MNRFNQPVQFIGTDLKSASFVFQNAIQRGSWMRQVYDCQPLSAQVREELRMANNVFGSHRSTCNCEIEVGQNVFRLLKEHSLDQLNLVSANLEINDRVVLVFWNSMLRYQCCSCRNQVFHAAEPQVDVGTVSNITKPIPHSATCNKSQWRIFQDQSSKMLEAGLLQ